MTVKYVVECHDVRYGSLTDDVAGWQPFDSYPTYEDAEARIHRELENTTADRFGTSYAFRISKEFWP